MVTDLPGSGLLADLPAAVLAGGAVLGAAALAFTGAPLWLWSAVALGSAWLAGAGPVALGLLGLALGAANLPLLRRALVSDRIFGLLRGSGILPAISATEREAIEAGDVWIDGTLFSGKPDLRALVNAPWPRLRPDEQAFLDGPVAAACAATDDWQVWQERDLPPEVWDLLRRERFFGMIVPQQYGGLGFSATAHSEVIQRLATRSLPLAITVMVPNSLGPAELLIHYGTEAQKQRWLPALARGDELPCFALTEPGAGSDAAAIRSRGVVFRGDDGELWLRLDWDKRYITLAAVATVLGLAFQLEDPERLLDGETEHFGITCALVPTSTPGVVLGRRHDPLGVPFYNCPTRGEGVAVRLDEAVIGGRAGVGRGWRMLMECLAAGRGISLPATSTGGAKLCARAVGAYAAVRRQFGLEIGRFEGVEEKLARIAAHTWLLDAARQMVTGGLDAGARPPVVTAIAKYWFTELFREVINDAMDVAGGAGISRGPNNLLAHAYVGCPISITVEGANVLTRTLMVFGQGAIRCHGIAIRELEALRLGDRAAFDRAFWGHAGLVLRNGVRSALLSLTRGRLARAPVRGPAAPYWRRLQWASASFALLADLAMAGLGGDLKRREKITGRFADIFGWLLLITAALRRFEAEGRRPADVPLLQWSCEHGFARIQAAMQGLCRNLPLPGLGWLLRGPVALFGRLNPLGHGPGDRLGARVARGLLVPGEDRDRLTAGVFPGEDEGRGLGRLERALQACAAAAPAAQKIKDAVRRGALRRAPVEDLIDEAAERGLVDPAEVGLLRAAERARGLAIAVDSFALDEYLLRPAAAATATAGR